MTLTNECKKTAAIILRGCGIGYDKLTARTVSFEDLARAKCVFVKVKVHGLRFDQVNTWRLASATAREHGFRLEV